MKTFKLAGAIAAGALVLTACSGTGQDEGAESSEDLDLTYAVITHGDPTDSFWSVVKAGADRAGEDLGVEIQYNSDPEASAQAELIDTAVADEVDGIVVSMSNPDGLKSAVQNAVDSGIPVITINSGLDQYEEFGAITHVGQSESIAGEAAGQRLADNGASKMICVIHEAGNTGLEERCAGAKKAFSGTTKNLQIDSAETGPAQESILAALQADDSVDAVLTLNGQVALGAAAAVEEAGSEVAVATFDLSEEVLNAVTDGSIAFAIDQQPYTQGYLGVQFLYLKDINGNDVGGGQPVYSGPAFVTEENAEQVLEYADNGTR